MVEDRALVVLFFIMESNKDAELRDGQQGQHKEDKDQLILEIEEVLDGDPILQEWIILVDCLFLGRLAKMLWLAHA